MDVINNMLDDLNLTETEYNIYVALLKSEKSLASDIIKKLKLHRATVYDVLNRLIEKGLASYILINNKKYYSGTNPEKLNNILIERKKELEIKEQRIKKIVQDLSKLKLVGTDKKHIATIYEGKEGLKTIMQEILATKKNFYSLGGEELRFQDLLPIYTKFWAKERERLKIYAKKLLTEPKLSNWKYNIEKQVPKGYGMPSSILIYGNKVAIMINIEPLTIIVIDNKNVAQSYISHFNMLWDLF
jgi:HTH-type transcriptional regulator, sugar sensing transcriptional regulator